MITVIRATLIILFGLVANDLYAAEWRGIIPLRSTRADVVRLLNQCSDQREACRFTLEKENVHILFSTGLQTEYVECATRLASETVMFIEVEPPPNQTLHDLHLEKKRLDSFNPSAPFKHGLKGYRSNDGLVIRTFKDRVQLIYYIADAANKHACPKYYERPESFVEVMIVHVPIVFIDCPLKSVGAGQALKFSAQSNINEKRGYSWTLSAGRITSGQYTQQITVDTTGLVGQTIVVTAQIGDGISPYVSTSCEVRITSN